MKTYYDRFLYWYGLCSAKHLAEGKVWYPNALEFVKAVAKEYNLTHGKIAGVLAALSPSVVWERNKYETEVLCKSFVMNQPLEDSLTTYGGQIEKAYRILRTRSYADVLKVLGPRAFKTKAFCSNVLNPIDSKCVTIDRHMLIAASEIEIGGRKGVYSHLEMAVQEVARFVSTPVPEVQASIWLCVKEYTEAAPF